MVIVPIRPIASQNSQFIPENRKKTWEKWHKNCRGQEGVPRDLHQQGKWRQKLGVSGTASLRSLQYPPIYPKKYEKKTMLSEGK